MNRSLISINDLLTQGWTMLLKDWKRLLEISIRFLIAQLIIFLAILIDERLAGSAVALVLVAAVISLAINTHTTITLADFILKRNQAPETEAAIDNQRAFQLFFPLVWVIILTSLAILGGLILFILPGIWLSILLGFAIFVLIDENKRGTQALARSAELVKGRWWGTLARLLVTTVVVTVIALLIILAFSLLLGVFVGFDQVFNFSNQETELTSASVLQGLLGSLVQTALIPLSFIYQAKLYHSLKATR